MLVLISQGKTRPTHKCEKEIGRSTRLLPHAKVLLDPIHFSLTLDYALEGSTFLLSKCDCK